MPMSGIWTLMASGSPLWSSFVSLVEPHMCAGALMVPHILSSSSRKGFTHSSSHWLVMIQQISLCMCTFFQNKSLQSPVEPKWCLCAILRSSTTGGPPSTSRTTSLLCSLWLGIPMVSSWPQDQATSRPGSSQRSLRE